jgi:hypothetical protein
MRSAPVRFAPVVLAFLAVVGAALLTRPDTPPPAGGLDSAVEMFYPYWQSQHGLELGGHYSWTLQTFHPGPLYPWVSVLGGASASVTFGGAWFAWGAWLAVVAVSVLAYAAGWRVTRTLVAAPLADLAAITLAAWMLLHDGGDWFSHVTLNTPHWGPSLSPPFAALAIVSTWKTVRVPNGRSAALALLSTGLLAQTTIGVTPLAAVLSVLVVTALVTVRSGRAFVIAGSGAVAGWWWFVARAVSEGPLFMLPPAGASPVQPGLDASDDPVDIEFAFRAITEHTGLHPVVAALVTAAILLLAVRRLRGRRRELVLVVVLVLTGWGQIFLLYPQRYTAYQSAWVEPVWVAGVVFAVAALLHRLATSRGASCSAGSPLSGRLSAAGLAVAFALLLAAPGRLDAGRALNMPYEEFPSSVFTTVEQRYAASGNGGPLVLAFGPAPELHGAAAMWFVTRGVPVCLADVASQPGGRSPLDRIQCSERDLADARFWFVSDTAAVEPAGVLETSAAFPYRGAQRWELYETTR